ncbi:M15 family metallopeptidase [Actinoplanes sp. CA-015351]|uniref:M15 family metallopeptidase n=1 Tax=Actinoplanes sp. CA-015351 TaxID=3239897 RepID=UPI003D976C69
MWKTLSVALLALFPAVPASASEASVSHVVQPGETLAAVASRHGVRVADLRDWNGLGSYSRLRADGMLRLAAPRAPIPEFRTRTEVVSEKEANGSVGRKCPVPVEELRRIWVRYIDFQGKVHNGSLIMHGSLVAQTQRSFAQLYRWRFPIMVMQPASVNMPGLTDRSVLTGGYECRFVAGTTKWSQHSYGRAVDVNPRQNPMIRGDYLDPPNTEKWLARENYWPGMVHEGGAVEAFTGNGFAWGGRWKSLKDYMHFSTTNL